MGSPQYHVYCKYMVQQANFLFYMNRKLTCRTLYYDKLYRYSAVHCIKNLILLAVAQLKPIQQKLIKTYNKYARDHTFTSSQTVTFTFKIPKCYFLLHLISHTLGSLSVEK
jgi:hypothetical protein